MADDGNEAIGYTYDGRGNRLSEARAGVEKKFTYNDAGLVKKSTIKVGGATEQSV
ncbi:MAG: hypothetical protein LBI54_08505, partial [Lachnospiraceae bacterium]|nr:hypothetical protein [Lachnospiraceae bacterium]